MGEFLLQGSSSSILMSGAEFSPSGTLYVTENGGSHRGFTVNLSSGALTYIGTPTLSQAILPFLPAELPTQGMQNLLR